MEKLSTWLILIAWPIIIASTQASCATDATPSVDQKTMTGDGGVEPEDVSKSNPIGQIDVRLTSYDDGEVNAQQIYDLTELSKASERSKVWSFFQNSQGQELDVTYYFHGSARNFGFRLSGSKVVGDGPDGIAPVRFDRRPGDDPSSPFTVTEVDQRDFFRALRALAGETVDSASAMKAAETALAAPSAKEVDLKDLARLWYFTCLGAFIPAVAPLSIAAGLAEYYPTLRQAAKELAPGAFAGVAFFVTIRAAQLLPNNLTIPSAVAVLLRRLCGLSPWVGAGP